MRHPGRMARAALAAALMAACANTPPLIGEVGAEVPDRREEAAYRAVADRYSGHAEDYAGLDTQLFLGATFQSATFREARVRRQATFQVWPRPKLDAELAQARSEAAQYHEVVFAVSIPERRFDDFEDKGSIWRVSLSSDTGQATPLTLRRLGRADANWRSYYPYMGDFWTVYSARFPLEVDGKPLVGPSTKQLVFRVASSQARAEIAFPPQ